MDSNKFPLIPGAGLDSANINNPDLSPVIGLDSAKPVSSEKLVSAQIIPPAIPIPSSTTLFVASLPSQLPEKIEKIALVYSALDKAGMLIFEEIKKIGLPDWAVPYEVSKEIIFANLSKIKEEKVIFLSKHKSDSGTKSLTVHMIGNFRDAKFGGKSMELSGALPWIGANFLRSLNEKNVSSGLGSKGFTVSYEATHHGPFSNKKCVFIELGSSPAEWGNAVAARVIAETVIESTLKRVSDKIVIGLGGGHYAPDFTKLALRKNYAFGHICPKHHLENLNNSLIQKMIRQSRASEIILDWKGLGKSKERILLLCEKAALPVSRVQNLLK